MGIDKYMYVSINPPAIDQSIHVKYTKTETVDHPVPWCSLENAACWQSWVFPSATPMRAASDDRSRRRAEAQAN